MTNPTDTRAPAEWLRDILAEEMRAVCDADVQEPAGTCDWPLCGCSLEDIAAIRAMRRVISPPSPNIAELVEALEEAASIVDRVAEDYASDCLGDYSGMGVSDKLKETAYAIRALANYRGRK